MELSALAGALVWLLIGVGLSTAHSILNIRSDVDLSALNAVMIGIGWGALAAIPASYFYLRYTGRSARKAVDSEPAGVMVFITRTGEAPDGEPIWKCQLLVDVDQFTSLQAVAVLEEIVTGIREDEASRPSTNGAGK